MHTYKIQRMFEVHFVVNFKMNTILFFCSFVFLATVVSANAKDIFEIKGSVALITGGVSGIGLEIAKELLRKEAKGVSLVDIHKDGKKVVQKLSDEFGSGRAVFIKTDVTVAQQLEDAFKNTIKIFDQLDLVFNNAGIVDEINWEKAINTNLVASIRGTMLATEKYLSRYSKKAYSVVVNTASVVALRTYPPLAVYSASKSGIVSFTKNMGILYEQSKMRIIAICPGTTRTNIFASLFQNIPERNWKMMENAKKNDYVQEPEIVASHVINILGSAPSGSIWKMENRTCQRIE